MGDLKVPITWRCLTPVPREPKPSANHSVFAVPKCIFINICSLTKTKNKVRAVVALEADMWQNDIAVCVVMEKHLKPAQPDAKVNIANCSIFNDYRSTLYEAICINLRLPTGHQFLVCGMYHLPKRKYAEVDSMSHITNIVDINSMNTRKLLLYTAAIWINWTSID